MVTGFGLSGFWSAAEELSSNHFSNSHLDSWENPPFLLFKSLSWNQDTCFENLNCSASSFTTLHLIESPALWFGPFSLAIPSDQKLRNLALSTSHWATCLGSSASVNSRLKFKWVREMSSNTVPKEAAPELSLKVSHELSLRSVVSRSIRKRRKEQLKYWIGFLVQIILVSGKLQSATDVSGKLSKGNYQRSCPLCRPISCRRRYLVVKRKNSWRKRPRCPLWGAKICA